MHSPNITTNGHRAQVVDLDTRLSRKRGSEQSKRACKPSSPQDSGLSELARQVRDAHCQVARAAADVLRSALACGDLLIAAKSRVPHGQWLPWLRRDCDVGERAANAYMQLARNRRVFEANPQRAADLSLRGALRLVSKKPGSASRPALRPAAKPHVKNSDVVDVLGWWSRAGNDRRRFLDNVGWKELAEAIPPSWYPEMRKWLDARTSPAPATRVDHSGDLAVGDLAIPDDLSIPTFLKRDQVRP